MVRARTLLMAVAICASAAAPSAAMTVQLSADRTRVGVGDVFSVTVAITIDDGSTAPDPDLTMPKSFDVVGTRSSTSTSISIVNGAVSQTRTVNVVSTLRANEAGTFTVGPATVESGGKTVRSQAIRVEVVQGLAKPRAATPSGQDAVTGDQLREIEENLFIRAEPDRERVYVGEQILLSYDLYARYRIQNPRFGAIPSYTGFWAESVFDATRLEQRPEVIDGRSFNRSRLKQVALFPTSPGKHALEQLEFICDIPVRSRRRSVFDVDDFFSWDPFRSRQVTVRSSDLEIEVRPLPAGAPPAFSGGVGRFDIAASLSATEATQGDPVTVTVVVSGEGNLHGVGEPTAPGTDDFRFYDPKATPETRFEGGRLRGTKTFEYVAIPRASGRVVLPPFEMAYFDPARERYVSVSTEPLTLRVKAAARVEQVSLAPAAGSAVELIGRDIRHIKPDAESLGDDGDFLHASAFYWSLNVLPVLALAVAWGWRRRRMKLEGDVAYARRRRSTGEARRRLADARNLIDGDRAAFYGEVHRALSAFLADRANLDVANLTATQAREVLGRSAVDDALSERVVQVFETCDFARFAPGGDSETDRQDLIGRVEQLIGDLERVT